MKCKFCGSTDYTISQEAVEDHADVFFVTHECENVGHPTIIVVGESSQKAVERWGELMKTSTSKSTSYAATLFVNALILGAIVASLIFFVPVIP